MPEVWVLCALGLAVTLGTVFQRAAGQGLGMVAAPIFALLAPEFLPVTLLILGLGVGLASSTPNFAAVQKRDLAPGFAGRAFGALVGAWLAAQLAGSEGFGTLVALLIYLGIGLTLWGVRLPIQALTLSIAGTVAGIMATLTAVGAPPMALLYANTDSKRSTSTQNVFFFFGMAVSLGALWLAGLVTWAHLGLALILLPAVGVGLWLARPVSARIAKGAIRPWALGLSGASATILLLRQLF